MTRITRLLDTKTLDAAAKWLAASFIADRAPFDRAFVMREFWKYTFKDEFEYLVKAIKRHLGPEPLAVFEAAVAKLEPRSDEVFHALLEKKRLADEAAAAAEGA